MNKQEFAAGMSVLAAGLGGKKFEKETLRVYYEVLKDIPGKNFSDGILRVLSTHTGGWIPRAAEIRAYCVELPVLMEDTTAWNTFYDACCRWAWKGFGHEKMFSKGESFVMDMFEEFCRRKLDGELRDFVHALGRSFCEKCASSQDVTFQRKEFLEAWAKRSEVIAREMKLPENIRRSAPIAGLLSTVADRKKLMGGGR